MGKVTITVPEEFVDKFQRWAVDEVNADAYEFPIATCGEPVAELRDAVRRSFAKVKAGLSVMEQLGWGEPDGSVSVEVEDWYGLHFFQFHIEVCATDLEVASESRDRAREVAARLNWLISERDRCYGFEEAAA